jgi:hypothetical protein
MKTIESLHLLLPALLVSMIAAACSTDKIESRVDSPETHSNPATEVTVTLLQPESVTELHANLRAETDMPISENADIHFGFVYAQSSEDLFLSNPQVRKVQTRPEGNSGRFSCVTGDLEPATQFYYRAFASRNGVLYYGPSGNFTTLDFVSTVVTAGADRIDAPQAEILGTLSVTSVEQLEKSVWFLYSASSENLESLKASGQRIDATLTDNGTFVAKAADLGYSMTYHYVACAKIHERTVYGEVKTFQTGVLPVSASAVDMGLDVKWASCDLGSSSPEELGQLYAWGETEVKDSYTWENYKWGTSEEHVTKYNDLARYGTVDYKRVLDPEDDVARVKLGGKWRMPTEKDMRELVTNCDWVATSINGIEGQLFTSKKNGNTIFIPGGKHWSSSSYIAGLAYPCMTPFTSQYQFVDLAYCRCEGFAVRPVLEVK